MEKNKFSLVSNECTMFFDPLISLDKTEKLSLLSRINDTCGDLLSGEPTILPIPVDAPPDIPRLQLNSKNNSYAYGISLSRSDFRYNEIGDPCKKINDIAPELLKYENEILKIYKDEKKWNVSRLAFIVNYIVSLTNNVSNYISKKFIIGSPSYQSIELSLLRRSKIENININRWFRIKPTASKEDVLHLLIDVNSVAEEKLNLSVAQMMDFYKKAIPFIEGEIKDTFGELK